MLNPFSSRIYYMNLRFLDSFDGRIPRGVPRKTTRFADRYLVACCEECHSMSSILRLLTLIVVWTFVYNVHPVAATVVGSPAKVFQERYRLDTEGVKRTVKEILQLPIPSAPSLGPYESKTVR